MNTFIKVTVLFAVVVWAILLILIPSQIQEGTLTIYRVVNSLIFTANVVLGVFIIFELR